MSDKDSVEIKSSFTETIDPDQLELKNQLWYIRDQHHCGKLFWEIFPLRSIHVSYGA